MHTNHSITKWEWSLSGFLLLMAGVLIFQDLGMEPLGYPDELKSAERSTSFLTTGDWWAVHMNHEPNFNKPPLQYWCNALIYTIHPDKEFAIRLINGIFAWGVFALTLLLVWLMFTEEAQRKWIAPLAVYLLLLYGPFMEYARIGILDMGATFFSLLVLLASQLSRQNPKWWLLAGLAGVLGTLQKTPLPFAIWGFLLILKAFQPQERTSLKSLWLWGSLIFGALLAGIWPVVQLIRFGDIYFDRYVVFELTEMTKRDANLGPLTYIVWISKKWFLFAPLAFVGLVWALFHSRLKDKNLPNHFLFECSVLTLTFLVIMSCLTGHSHRYIFPVLPLLSILAAWCMYKVLRRWASHKYSLIAIILLVSFPSLMTLHYHYNLKRHKYKPFVPVLNELADLNREKQLPLFLSFSDSLDRGNMTRLVRYYGEVEPAVTLLHEKDALNQVRAITPPLLGLVSPDRISHLREMDLKIEELGASGGIHLIKIK
ncbi:MAG: glycosyltransferase family 39 protein [Verrucomicrobiota bacterium]